MYQVLSRRKQYFFLYFILNTLYLILHTSNAYALTTANDEYQLEMKVKNTFDNNRYSKRPTPTPTPPPPQPQFNQIITGTGNAIPSPLSFSISDSFIDYGQLSPTNPIIRKMRLVITSETPIGYSVFAAETNELNSQKSGSVIPNVTCDNGQCTEDIASTWTNPLTYGFGYRCDNDGSTDCANDFTDTANYKQFANLSIGKQFMPIMQGTTNKQKKSQISYKITIPGTQPPGLYRNAVTYLAIPNF